MRSGLDKKAGYGVSSRQYMQIRIGALSQCVKSSADALLYFYGVVMLKAVDLGKYHIDVMSSI